MRVTALSSINGETSRHLQEAIYTSRQVKSPSDGKSRGRGSLGQARLQAGSHIPPLLAPGTACLQLWQ